MSERGQKWLSFVAFFLLEIIYINATEVVIVKGVWFRVFLN